MVFILKDEALQFIRLDDVVDSQIRIMLHSMF